jgi:hypothetical protein
MPASIFFGLACVGVYIAAVTKHRIAPNLAPLAWTGLFWSTGYNFLSGSMEGRPGSWVGWLMCAFFVGLGAPPVIAFLPDSLVPTSCPTRRRRPAAPAKREKRRRPDFGDCRRASRRGGLLHLVDGQP